MFQNYLKMAWRSLIKNRLVSFINLFGLTVGLTCCILITVYVLHETNYDSFHKNASRIYRVGRSFNNKDGTVSLRLGTVAPPFGPLLQNYFPDIQKMTRLLPNGKVPMRYGEKIFNEDNVYFADENLFDVFTIPVLKGDPKTALLNPYTVMLSDKMAEKYFGKDDPIHKQIRMNNQLTLTVTGVFKSLPDNSHIHPSIMVAFNTLRDSTVYGEKNLQTNFGNNSFFTYLLLPKDYPADKMEAQFPAFLDHSVHFPGAPADFRTSTSTKLFLQKLTDIHLRSHLDFEAEENGDIKRVYIFSIIALVILLIAGINYMNLSTARSALRAREIGIRKVAGATRKELVTQFLCESVLLTYLALLLAIVAAYFTLPLLSGMAGLHLSFDVVWQQAWWPVLLFIPLIVGLLSGIYPALFLSSFRPALTLKGLFRVGGRSISLRKALVVTQFGISILLIITTIVVFQQLSYMQKTDMGYNKDQIVILPYYFTSNSQYEAFRTDMLKHSVIADMGRSSRVPTGRLLDSDNASSESGDSLRPINTELKYLAADYDFIPSYGINMAAGRNFSRSFSTDTTGFIINEATVQVLGWKNDQQAVGRNFMYGNVKGKIIGVVKDFHFESLHQRIVPLVMCLPRVDQNNFYNQLSVKISGKKMPEALAALESGWRQYLPEMPFDYTFLDNRFQQLYVAEQRQSSLFSLFAGIAIVIACLGLFGLSSFAITQRIKEIGIRKVLGANVSGIVLLLSKDFLLLVMIAALISFPIAWYAMQRWLGDFAYRISLQWWVFITAGILAAAVALITVSVQAIQAATANPIKSLRTE